MEQNHMSLEEVVAWLDRKCAERDAEAEEIVKVMRSEGREPAPIGGLWGTLCPVFRFTLRWSEAGSDKAEIRFRAVEPNSREDIRIWGQDWPEHGALLSGSDLLASLAANWPVIAQDFLTHHAQTPSPGGLSPVSAEDAVRSGGIAAPSPTILAMGQEMGRPDLPYFALRIQGREIALLTGTTEIKFGSESVIVVEVLLTLGNLVAQHLRDIGLNPDIVTAWERVSAMTDVPPTSPEIVPDDLEEPDLTDDEAAYWARRLGQDVAQYRLAAIWLMARQWLSSAGKHTEPSQEDRQVTLIPAALPDHSEIMALAAEAVSLRFDEMTTVEEFAHLALQDRNDCARQLVLYKDWPERFCL